MIKKIILVIIGIGLLLGGYYGWKFYTGVQYSLIQIIYSLKEHDFVRFKKYVDTDGIITSLMRDQFNSDSATNNPFEELAISLRQTMMDNTRDRIEIQIEGLVEKGEFVLTEEVLNEEPAYRILQDTSTSFEGVKYIKPKGKVSNVGLEFYFPRYDSTLILDLFMRDKGHYWQVSEITNLKNLLRTVDELETNFIKNLNKPIEKTIDEIIYVWAAKSELRSDQFGLVYELPYVVKFQNQSAKDISNYVFDIYFMNEDKVLSVLSVSNEKGQVVKSLNTGTIYNVLMDHNSIGLYIYDVTSIEARATYLRFSDNTEISLYNKFQSL